MALLCYNKGCGQRFDASKNSEGKWICFPGVSEPLFHKGVIFCPPNNLEKIFDGCMKGCHSNEKPPEPFRPEDTSDKLKAKPSTELIVQSPKSAEKLQPLMSQDSHC
uniref:CHORD domain-containing protein n=1 Tax=Chelonoidis abingdonii TaxID=106734 RepID=A0A8C0GGV5_CHEAB